MPVYRVQAGFIAHHDLYATSITVNTDASPPVAIVKRPRIRKPCICASDVNGVLSFTFIRIKDTGEKKPATTVIPVTVVSRWHIDTPAPSEAWMYTTADGAVAGSC